MSKTTPEVLLFAALAVVWTYPLVTNLSGQIPGFGPGDNLQFLWNFWWMRIALSSGFDFLHSSYLFVPAGADLTLHTTTSLGALLGATASRALTPAAALNLWITVSLFLNGWCAYLLAWRVTGDRSASIIGGLVFAASPFIAGRLIGHFNFVAAFTLPLFMWAALRALQGNKKWAVLAGLVLAATAYMDYYYVAYLGLLVVVTGAATTRHWSLRFQGRGSATRVWLSRILGALVTLDLLIIGAIVALGGFTTPVGAYEISARGLYNPLQVFWLPAFAWCWLRFSPAISSSPRAGASSLLTPLFIIAVVFVAGAAPMIASGVRLILEGDYVTQKYFWRSAPSGVDLASLVMGHPFHGLLGGPVRSIYDALGIDALESSAWLGLIPVALAAVALRDYRTNASTRLWAAIASVFFVWSLGPHLKVFGSETGMILPAVFVRYVPLVNNARVPSRAMAVVTLAVAMLAAIGMARWRPAFARRPVVLAAVTIALVAEMVPAPFAMTPLTVPKLYEILRDRPETGAVCELPMGLRDGFGGRGTMDVAPLYYQTIHGRPMTGGYIGRIPPSVMRAYADDPLLDGLLRLSEADESGPPPLPSRAIAAERLRTHGIAFVVLNRQIASPKLIDYVDTVLPVELIQTEGPRSLYLVKHP